MEPYIIKKFKKKHLFGLVSIDYHVEHRTNNPDKYKHFIEFYILNKRYNWTFHTEYPYDDLPYTG